jgi:lactoylglutathione lyase
MWSDRSASTSASASSRTSGSHREGEAGYVGLGRGDYELAITTTQSPEHLIGVKVGSDPRFEMFVYVDDVDETVAQLRAVDGRVLKEPEDMFWGERVAYVADPDGNPVALAAAPDQPSARNVEAG